MTETIQTFLLLLSVLAAVAILARRLDVAPSILLVIAGIGLALVPGLPSIELAPELVLLVILPPLLYSAAVAMSWREFRFNLRPIFLLAFGAVVFTTCAVAVAAHYVIGLPWAVGFLLGAIVSPPDAVAPLAVARKLRLPRRLLLVLEGEGVANDATALILYRFAVAAVSTGTFALGEAAGTFAAIVGGEIVWGIAVGWLSLRLRRWARDPRVEITLSLMTPYIAYWIPEHLGGSGVLATVAAGLYVSWRGPLLIPSATRLQGIFFWDLIIYLIEGFVFLVVGLQARTLLARIEAYSLRDLAVAVALTTLIVIVARFVWVFPAVYLPRWLIPPLARRDPSPPWEQAFVLAFVGVRGVVSLAAALAIPFLTAGGQVFPHRDLILFVTFGVIVVTLVGQGLMLPAVIRWLGLARDADTERSNEQAEELAARQDAIETAHRRMEELLGSREIPAEAAELLRLRHDHRRRQLVGDELRETVAELKLDLLRVEREFLFQLLREGRITDEARRRLERELDLEEAAIISRRGEASVLPL
ncbi:MAG TPA: Na+/H+ antiporter [Xanthobacteraceae bacterium]|nr:Na+/H+ antiporter [Xanthobacteraceae bacterium]